MKAHRALILRSNRFLGSTLIDQGLIAVGDLEAANEIFMTTMQSDSAPRASILTALLHELKVLDEKVLIQNIVDNCDLGLIDLDFIKPSSLRPMNLDLDLCWATSTVPFDQTEGIYMVATCYYLSAPVIKYWEEILGGRVIWYATTTASISRSLERIQEIHEAEDLAAVEAEAEA
ncbi:MAG: hypothetical protein ACI81V_000044 [Lentimonas sp.]|jgi:hypothetical protein